MGLLEQPVAVFVKVIFAVPTEAPVTTPPLVIVAMARLLLNQVPPELGVRFIVFPIQTCAGEGTVTIGIGFIVILNVAKF